MHFFCDPQAALAVRERAVGLLLQIDTTADGAVTVVAQAAENAVANPDQMSGELMVRLHKFVIV